MTSDYPIHTQPAAQQLVGVIGAGTMGAGIAQVAAAAGHPVRLMDARPEAARAAHDNIAAALSGLVGKGRMSGPERDAILARIVPVDALAELAEAALVVEVIVEQLQAKQTLAARTGNPCRARYHPGIEYLVDFDHRSGQRHAASRAGGRHAFL